MQDNRKYSSLEHQIHTFAKLLDIHKAHLSPTRLNEITWALEAAKTALATGDTEDAIKKLHVLEHIREELIIFEKS